MRAPAIPVNQRRIIGCARLAAANPSPAAERNDDVPLRRYAPVSRVPGCVNTVASDS